MRLLTAPVASHTQPVTLSCNFRSHKVVELSLGSVYWLQAKSQSLVPEEKPFEARQTAPQHFLFILLPDSWGQTGLVVPCPVLMAQSALSSQQQLRALVPRPQGLWQVRVARGSSC